MNKKLYVGNLPFNLSEDELKGAFAPFGTVESARIIMDKFSGRSKGFAFVEMSSGEEAEKAAADMNGKEIGGRKLIVSEARPEQPRSPGGSGGGHRPYGGGGGGGGGGRGRGGGGGGGGGYGDRPPRQDRGGGRGFRDGGGGGGGYYNSPMDPPQNTKRDSKDHRHTSSDDDDDDNRWNR